jgi:hypothetical protein
MELQRYHNHRNIKDHVVYNYHIITLSNYQIIELCLV